MTAVNISKDIPNKILFPPGLGNFFESLSDQEPFPSHWRSQKKGRTRGQTPPGSPGAGGVAACPMVHTSSQRMGHSPTSMKCEYTVLTKRALRMYGTVLNGFNLPGRYYFFTLTSSPQSPPIRHSWVNLKKWLRRQRPGIEWVYCFTNEGCGVIHMVFRLPMKSKNFDINKVREYWTEAHKARQMKLVRVKNPHDLASYLANQKANKKRTATEFLYQPGLEIWNRSRGWLPTGITKHIRRVAFKLRDQPVKVKEICINDYVKRVHAYPGALRDPPFILGGTIYHSIQEYRQSEGEP